MRLDERLDLNRLSTLPAYRENVDQEVPSSDYKLALPVDAFPRSSDKSEKNQLSCNKLSNVRD